MMQIGGMTFHPKTARNFALHGKIAASALFCENKF